MSSNQDISSLLGDFSKTFSELVNRLQPTPGTTANNASAFDSARNALRSLQSDSRMANDVSLTFNRSVSAENSSSSSRPTLPSVARRQAASHRFSPYNGKGRKKSLRQPKRYDMKLLDVLLHRHLNKVLKVIKLFTLFSLQLPNSVGEDDDCMIIRDTGKPETTPTI